MIFDLLLLLVICVPCEAQLKGGGGHKVYDVRISPYNGIMRMNVLKMTVDNMNFLKKQADSSRIISHPKIVDQYPIAMSYVKINNSEPCYFISGFNSISNNYINIEFSRIEHIKMLKYDSIREQNLVELIVFPTIEVDKLFEMQPTYLELKNNFCDTLELWLKNTDHLDRELCLIQVEEKKGNNDYIVHKIINLSELEIGKTIEFGYINKNNTPIWWAISSVFSSNFYPYVYSSYSNAGLNLDKGIFKKR